MKREPETQQVKRMNLNVPVDLHNTFKSTTAAEGLNMTDVLIAFIQSYVDQHAAKPPQRRRLR